MEISTQGFLTNFLLKNQVKLNIAPKETLENLQALKYEILPKSTEFLTVSIDKEHFIKIPLLEILGELDVKATPDNLFILKKLLEHKLPLSKDKFTSLARIMGEIPHHQEEILGLLFNPLLRLFILNNQEEEKTLLYLNQETPDNQGLELTILYHQPKTEDILIKIFWESPPVISMYFSNQEIKELFASRIHQLKECLDSNYQVNLYHRKKLPVEAKESAYYKIDLKI